MFNYQTEDEINYQSRPETLTQKNIKIIRKLMKVSPISMIFLTIMWIMAIFLAIKTGSWFFYYFVFPSPILNQYGANSLFGIRNHQYFRLVTAIILHGGLIHIIANTVSFFTLMFPMQAKYSWKLFLSITLLGGIQGNMLSDLSSAYFHYPYILSVGASTSICAVLGLYYVETINKSFNNEGMPCNTIKILIANTVILIICSLMPGVDFFGHFGSLIAGILLGGAVIFKVDGQYQKNFKKLNLICKIAFVLYTLALMSVFFI